MKKERKEFYTQFGMSVMKLRRSKKFSREYLADKADLSPRFLFEIENGEKGCSVYSLCMLADSLEADVDSLIR